MTDANTPELTRTADALARIFKDVDYDLYKDIDDGDGFEPLAATFITHYLRAGGGE